MKSKFKIRPTIISIFIFTATIIISTSLSLQYYFLQEFSVNASEDKLISISQNIKSKVISLDKNNKDIINMLAFNDNIEMVPKPNQRHPHLKRITNFLNTNMFITSIYVGDKLDNFYQVVNLTVHHKVRGKYNAPINAKWLIVKVLKKNNNHIKYFEFLDNDLLQISQRNEITKYRATKRPWYKDATNHIGVIKTAPYLFALLKTKGVTYAKISKNKQYVLGMDIFLIELSTFLKSQLKNIDGDIHLLHTNNKIIVSTNKNLILQKNDYIRMQNKLKLSTLHFEIKTINGKEYFSYYSKLNSISLEDEYIHIVMPTAPILDKFKKKIIYSFIIASLMLLILIPLLIFTSKLLIQPIQKLMMENQKIKNMDFKNIKLIKSNIKEISDLSNSFYELSNSIQEYENDQKKLMDSFMEIIASAIDAKSKYTGGHCERVPILTMLLVKEASNSNDEVFKDFSLKNEKEIREVSIAAWLHDCGKVTTPEYVVDKATKLETIYNRIHEIRTRFEVIHRDLYITYLKNIIAGKNQNDELKILNEKQNQLKDDFAFLANSNIGSEFMSDENINKINEIAQQTWQRNFDNSLGISRDERERLGEIIAVPAVEKLLDDKKSHIVQRDDLEELKKVHKKHNFKIDIPTSQYDFGEIYNLSIKKGTLSNEERYKINEHIIMSIIMLEQLSFPKNLKRVPEYATMHHETLIGTGYPRRLSKEDMPIPSRILALADVFEALTASDRPYKEAKTLSESIKILSFMVKDKHLDEDLFKLFLSSGIYKDYAQSCLNPSQIDEVDISKYL